jgi:hypothetical protein
MAWQKLNKLTVELYRRLYWEEKKNMTEIAAMFGVTRAALYKWFHKHKPELADGLPRRSGNSKGYMFNEHFFDVWTPQMAYVLGVLATDGNVGKSYVSITSTDLELAEKVRTFLESSHPLHVIPPRGVSRKTQYDLKISSTRLADKLTKLGIGPAKSLTLQFPEMPADCVRHFLRGCWDGDGSFYYESPRKPRPEAVAGEGLVGEIREDNATKLRASYVSGSKRFIEAIMRHLENAGIRTLRGRKLSTTDRRSLSSMGKMSLYQTKRGKNTSYYFRLAGPNAIALGRLLYEAVPESMYLTRKFEKFKAAVAGNRANMTPVDGP